MNTYYSENGKGSSILGESSINCLPGWALVLTPDGYKFVHNLQNKIYIDGKDVECSNIIKANKTMGVYEVLLECGIPAFMTLTHKINIPDNNDKPLEELKIGDPVKVYFTDISENKVFDQVMVNNGVSSWDDFQEDIDIILHALNFGLSYQAGVIIGAIIKNCEIIDNALCISNKSLKEPTLQMLQILMSEFGIYSHLQDDKLIIITIVLLEKLFKRCEYNKSFQKIKIDSINTPKFYNSKMLEEQKIANILFHSNNDVYDIQVPETNHFVTSSIIVHNSN